ncbi:TPA: Clp protease ClpP [Staphylococcus aureus]|nr:Clp protease ClpP [Staphylococcus aureus]
MSMKAKYFQMKRKSKSKGEIFIYGDIVSDKWFESDVTATDFKNKLDELGDISEIDVHINSSGGSVFEGHAIYNMLKMHPAKINIYVDALAASIASVIAMSGDTIFMHKNSFLMIHNSWVMTVGNAEELRKTADLLEKTDAASISKEQYKRFENVPEDLKKDVDKITKIDDVDTSELVETPKESMSLEEKEKREKIKRECEILKMTMNY